VDVGARTIRAVFCFSPCLCRISPLWNRRRRALRHTIDSTVRSASWNSVLFPSNRMQSRSASGFMNVSSCGGSWGCLPLPPATTAESVLASVAAAASVATVDSSASSLITPCACVGCHGSGDKGRGGFDDGCRRPKGVDGVGIDCRHEPERARGGGLPAEIVIVSAFAVAGALALGDSPRGR